MSLRVREAPDPFRLYDKQMGIEQDDIRVKALMGTALTRLPGSYAFNAYRSRAFVTRVHHPTHPTQRCKRGGSRHALQTRDSRTHLTRGYRANMRQPCPSLPGIPDFIKTHSKAVSGVRD